MGEVMRSVVGTALLVAGAVLSWSSVVLSSANCANPARLYCFEE